MIRTAPCAGWFTDGLAIDVNGDVYVAGKGYLESGNEGWITAKYSGDDGTPLWRIGFPCEINRCYIGALALDSEQNVFVGGDVNTGTRDVFKTTTIRYVQTP